MQKLSVGLVLLLAACGTSSGEFNQPDAAPLDARGPVAKPPTPDANIGALVARGDYLVNAVLACEDCHTPRTMTGAFDNTKKLSGVECFVDIMPPADNGMGCLHSRNLTNDDTGLKGRSDAEIKDMLLNGKRPNGQFLFPVMPYFLFHNLTDADANSIIAYLRTLPAVSHTVPSSEMPFFPVAAAASPVLDSEIPAAGGTGTVHDSAVRGRYTAMLICIDCHTPTLTPPFPKPLDYTKAFQGGRGFQLGIPGLPETIYSANLTPHSTGTMGWVTMDIVNVLLTGKDKAGNGVCPPMPVGPMGAFGKMKQADAEDVANYMLSLAPVSNTIPNGCFIPAP